MPPLFSYLSLTSQPASFWLPPTSFPLWPFPSIDSYISWDSSKPINLLCFSCSTLMTMSLLELWLDFFDLMLYLLSLTILDTPPWSLTQASPYLLAFWMLMAPSAWSRSLSLTTVILLGGDNLLNWFSYYSCDSFLFWISFLNLLLISNLMHLCWIAEFGYIHI